MQLESIKPIKTLNKAYLKEKVTRNHIELFKKNLQQLLSRINEQESEENLKNVIADFLKNTWYKDEFEINTKDRKDLVIHTGKTAKEPVGVILEVKKPSNKAEMISQAKPNAKALQELILYYLRERVDHNNTDIKYLIVTNIYEWFIMDEVWFEKNVFRNIKLKKDYENWKLSGKDTKFFYDSIAKAFLDEVTEELPATYFDVRTYEKYVINTNKEDDTKLIGLYKILSPAHLLKQPFINDSNSLDTKFYVELLHIIGLEEIKDGSKKLIKRKAKPDEASLIENTIIKLEDKDALRNISNLSTFGANKEEQLFNVALELCITWVNRVLFIKLLEAQLYKYHKGNKDYLFLNSKLVFDFDELSNLFFQVLAEKPESRRSHIQEKFSKVPYLNSSLFERIELERQTINISELDNRLQLPLSNSSVLKDDKGKRKAGTLPTLQYLFEFLDAYDFTSEGGEEIQEENKNLINASVLGLIFEKINGYKDGSFFTPGFVTMYMCKETIRRSVLQKFNDTKGWHCDTIDGLYNKIEDKKEANKIINSLHICDPAVGSGHFLVSALNEMIAIKSELKILQDATGKSLRDYHVEVVNDELIITDEDGKLFDYNPQNKESQRIQETLFHEKETIIENCLFGVDINPNSVKICRLRLWIELLKNAYYTPASNYIELETLPNIDINIKCGNSLISRFALDATLKPALKKSNFSITAYRSAVQTYRQAESKEEKREMEKLIDAIKNNFQAEIGRESKQYKDLAKLEIKYFELYEGRLFDQKISKQEAKARTDISDLIEKKKKEIEEIKGNKIYENAFEWRFEFPEVLNNDGDFIGFDVVIGNPPWGAEMKENFLKHIKISHQDIIVRMVDSFMFFIDLTLSLKSSKGIICQIIPDVVLYQSDNLLLREKIFKYVQLTLALNLGDRIFEDVARPSCIILMTSEQNNKTFVGEYNIELKGISNDLLTELNTDFFLQIPNKVISTKNIKGYSLLKRLQGENLLSLIDEDGIQRGISPDLKEAFIVDAEIIKKHNLENDFIHPTLTGGRDTKKYLAKDIGKRILYTKRDDETSQIKNIIKYVDSFKAKITCKEVIEGKHPIWALHRARESKIFEKEEKIIGVITGDRINVSLDREKIYATDGLYLFSSNGKYSNVLLVGILNSSLSTYLYRLLSMEVNRTLAQIKPTTLQYLPFKFKNENLIPELEVKVQSIIENLEVENGDVSILEKEIDHLVFQLYGLSKDEIDLIEQK